MNNLQLQTCKYCQAELMRIAGIVKLYYPRGCTIAQVEEIVTKNWSAFQSINPDSKDAELVVCEVAKRIKRLKTK